MKDKQLSPTIGLVIMEIAKDLMNYKDCGKNAPILTVKENILKHLNYKIIKLCHTMKTEFQT